MAKNGDHLSFYQQIQEARYELVKMWKKTCREIISITRLSQTQTHSIMHETFALAYNSGFRGSAPLLLPDMHTLDGIFATSLLVTPSNTTQARIRQTHASQPGAIMLRRARCISPECPS
jgi:hypothetical protein